MTAFKKNHVYGQILNYLYENTENTTGLPTLIDKIDAIDEDTEKNVWYLIKDEMIVKNTYTETGTNMRTGEPGEAEFSYYRISPKGYQFVHEIRTSQFNRQLSILSLVFSIVSFVVAAAIGIIQIVKQ